MGAAAIMCAGGVRTNRAARLPLEAPPCLESCLLSVNALRAITTATGRVGGGGRSSSCDMCWIARADGCERQLRCVTPVLCAGELLAVKEVVVVAGEDGGKPREAAEQLEQEVRGCSTTYYIQCMEAVWLFPINFLSPVCQHLLQMSIWLMALLQLLPDSSVGPWLLASALQVSR